MVLKISYNSKYWGTITGCNLLGGVISTSTVLKATCNVGDNYNIYITNVGGFITDPLLASTTNYRIKVKFTSTSLSDTANYGMNFYLTLYSNIDAYTNGYQGIFY